MMESALAATQATTTTTMGSFQTEGSFEEFYNNGYYGGYGNRYGGDGGFGMGGNNQGNSLQVNVHK